MNSHLIRAYFSGLGFVIKTSPMTTFYFTCFVIIACFSMHWSQSQRISGAHSYQSFISSTENDTSRLDLLSHSPTPAGLFNRTDEDGKTRSMGYVVCAGNKHRPDVQRMIYHLRHIWRTNLPFVIAHCNELDQDFQRIVMEMDQNIQLLNLCPENKEYLFGMSKVDAEKKLRGFFCKVAALLSSPLDETMLMDLDTVWFKNPEKLFHSKSYLMNKSLFFRDRLYNHELHGGRIGPDEILDMMSLTDGKGYHNVLSKDSKKNLFTGNGINMYFANFANQSYPQYNEHQDSSSVLLKKSHHARLIQTLQSWLGSFALGYGDKEIFWVASTISHNPYTWEPFLAGKYIKFIFWFSDSYFNRSVWRLYGINSAV